ncbi:DUF885 domain-containing protein [Terricaulis sp.]|uniref:DUF885 domain-containing protein n=1 Tax=Terricaulis sp. TaxID=2768686 RepID=UPI0037842C72
MHITRRTLMTATAAGAMLAAAGCNNPQAGGGSAEFNALLDRIATDILKEAPEYATSLGVDEAKAGGRYIDRLSDASKEGGHRRQQMAETALADLRRFNRDSLSAADKVSYDVVVTAGENSVEAGRFDYGSGATAPYVLTQLTGAYTGLPDFLASQHPVSNRDQADAYVTRLSAYKTMLDQEIAVLNADVGAGVIPPNFCILHVEGQKRTGAIPQLQTFIAKPAAENVLVTSFREKLNGVSEISAADKQALVQHAQQIVQDEIYPAYQRQVDALNAVLPRATANAGIGRLPQAQEMYAAALKSNTTTSMTPDEIHNMGLQLIQELTAEMDTILKAQGHSSGSVAERIRALSSDPAQLYPATQAGRDQLLADLNAQVQAMRARMGEVCGTLARADLRIQRVPEFTEAGAPGGYYQGAALDGSRPGTYYINLRPSLDARGRAKPYLEEWPKFTLPTLSYHEGIPGHHWQISIQQEAGAIPFLRSALLGFNAYAEGWGLYAEQLADEMGMYANNALGKVGYLQSATFRASRLVCDTGLHSKGWSREQAIRSMMDATGDQESSVTTEIERYCVWPGQATGYMVGRQAINRMRDAAKTALGQRFDIKGFHDTILTNGSAPLSVTESLVNEWVAGVQRG